MLENCGVSGFLGTIRWDAIAPACVPGPLRVLLRVFFAWIGVGVFHRARGKAAGAVAAASAFPVAFVSIHFAHYIHLAAFFRPQFPNFEIPP